MIIIDDIKYELRIEATDTSQDNQINRVLKRIHNFIKGYCNNYTLNFDDTSDLTNNPTIDELDEVVLFLSVRALNPETNLRAGKSSENQGTSFNFSDDLPKEYKRLLNKFRRFHFS